MSGTLYALCLLHLTIRDMPGVLLLIQFPHTIIITRIQDKFSVT